MARPEPFFIELFAHIIRTNSSRGAGIVSDRPSRYIIVGNGITGTTAAETIKKNEPSAQVTLIGKEPYPLYNRVALPRFLKGQVPESRVLMRSIEQHTEKGIDLMLETAVEKVNPEDKTVLLHTGKEMPYDRLLVAPGGRSRHLSVPGADAGGVYYFQTLDDTKTLVERALASKSAISVGGSYIAYELTEGFRQRGLHVTWLIRGKRFLHRVLDEAGGELVDRIARKHGVDVIYGEEVAQVEHKNGTITGVVTTGGRHIECDMMGAGLGLIINTEFLEGSGVETRRGIVTDASLRTNVPDIYAGGDAAEFFDVFLQDHNLMGTWNNSQGHGRVIARNMMGADEIYDDVPHYTTTMFHSNMTAMGMTTEAKPDLDSLSWVDYETENYRRLFFDGDFLVGAVLIGDMKPRRDIMQVIKSREPVENREKLMEAIAQM